MSNVKAKPKCKLCLKLAETHVKILGASEVTKAIEEIFHIKINDNNQQSIEILCLQCHNTVAEFYIFYNNIKNIQTNSPLEKLQIKEESCSDFEETGFQYTGLDDSDSGHKPIQSLVETELRESDAPKNKKRESKTGNDKVVKVSGRKKTLKKLKTLEKIKFEDDIFDTPVKKPRRVHTYYCDICGRDFKKYNFMKAHILQKHLGIFEDVCPHCGKTSFDKSTLKRHIDAVHLKTYRRRRDICPDCGVAVVALKLHRQLKHGIGAKVEKVMYTCDMCTLQYTKLMYLKRHIARKHLQRFDDKCPFCQKNFYNRMSVERHMQSQHPDLVPEEVKKKRLLENITSPCDLCEKVFHRRANYLRHRRTVHKEVPFNLPNVCIKPEF